MPAVAGHSCQAGTRFERQNFGPSFLSSKQGLTPRSLTNVVLRIYSDSQLAVTACGKHDSCTHTVKKIKAQAKFLGSRGYEVAIRWIAGQQSIQKMTLLIRLLLFKILDPGHEQTLNQTQPPSFEVEPHVFYYGEATISARAESRAALRN